ncbi:c-type cytochrome [Galbibacter mesophilus]|uniref:c-type cytochrome n=1 Tax=Galbibacter mesophilus TaxID=379069 RepID=UPI001F5CB048|nr:c-type cytochrome [Galbibacter mesophilus]MCM5662069.1 cytochrome c [Galbibacter mesophilus]
MNLYGKIAACMFALAIVSCGDGKKEKKEEKFQYQTNTPEKSKKEEESAGTPVDMDNEGVGPVSGLELPAEIDQEMVAKGKEIFNTKCTACHVIDKRLIGPPLKDVLDRRNPSWVMNMIINPDKMLKEDPIAIALMKEYNNAIMLNQNVKEDEARAIVEYIRSVE